MATNQGRSAVQQAKAVAIESTRRNAIDFGPGGRRVIRSAARLVNPLVLAIAGRRHMPILGIVHHRGRRSGRLYATPLGVRPLAGGFVMPLTFGAAAHWYQNINAAGWASIRWGGEDHEVVSPTVVDRATARPAFPAYERLAFRLLGIDQFLWLRAAPSGWVAPAAREGSPGR